MYGTTIKSYENKGFKNKKEKKEKGFFSANKKEKSVSNKEQDTKYMKINASTEKNEVVEESVSEGFSLKELPIASVVITVILTMMMLVMTSGFGGL